MIFATLSHTARYERLGPRFARAFEFLHDTALAELAAGRHDIDGDKVFAIVSDYQTKTVEESRWEAHRRHVDVQCVASGSELIGVAPLESLALDPYDEDNDILFASGDGQFVALVPGQFVVLFPEDAHMPGVSVAQPAPVRKVVVKVSV